jgi:hypothetical protein
MKTVGWRNTQTLNSQDLQGGNDAVKNSKEVRAFNDPNPDDYDGHCIGIRDH